MKCLVTGGTGFLGRHLVKQLLAEGHQVRVLIRSSALSLEREGAELVRGDVLQPETLTGALEGRDTVFHLAGRVQHRGDATSLYQLHVEGTRNLSAAAERQDDPPRFVHMSTSGTLAVSTGPQIADESAPYALKVACHWPYYLSKIYAEKVAFEAHARGRLPVVVVNPSLLLGPEDDSLSSSELLRSFLRREIPAVPPGGLNFVDVRDVAQASIVAAERGAPGSRYLLGGPNMTVEAFFVLLSKISGVPAPRIKASSSANSVASSFIQVLENLGGLEGDESAAYAMAGHYWYLNNAKAQQELDFNPRSAETTLRDAVAWLRSQGPIPGRERTLGSLVRSAKRILGQA